MWKKPHNFQSVMRNAGRDTPGRWNMFLIEFKISKFVCVFFFSSNLEVLKLHSQALPVDTIRYYSKHTKVDTDVAYILYNR